MNIHLHKAMLVLRAPSLLLLFMVPEGFALRNLGEGDASLELGFSLPLCARDIVATTCAALGGTSGLVARSSLEGALSANEPSIAEAWAVLGLSSESVACEALCADTLRALRSYTTLPPTSDVACYGINGRAQCDLDVSPTKLATMVFSNDLPDLHDDMEQKASADAELVPRGSSHPPADPAASVPYSTQHLLTRIANLFRVFPYLPISVTSIQDGSGSSLAQLAGLAEDWQVGVQKRNVEAQALISNAIKLLKASDLVSSRITASWFGQRALTEKTAKVEVLRVLNSVASIMMSVDYVFPGPACAPDKYAYVMPSGTGSKDAKGKFLFYLCQLYFDEPDEQIEVLTHEASHHATAYTDDVCIDELYGGSQPEHKDVPLKQLPSGAHLGQTLYSGSLGRAMTLISIRSGAYFFSDKVATLELEPAAGCRKKAYGRSSCLLLGESNTDKALRNADNFCYFLTDMSVIV